jgi:hypothetical protein
VRTAARFDWGAIAGETREMLESLAPERAG